MEYGEAGAQATRTAEASTGELHTPTTINDPRIHLHAATLTGLTPATRYRYRVGDGTDARSSPWAGFVTAPEAGTSFSFLYMGDAQNELDAWGELLRKAHARHPEARFLVLPGDLVDRGNDRDDWDAFFRHGRGVLDRLPLVPALGNHEYVGGDAELYLRLMHLPTNGPSSVGPERAYALRYGDALFVVLDSNADDLDTQSAWLDERLAEPAAWRFVAFHHPAYASHPERDHSHLLRALGPIFDRHGVDIVLQGHDHAYLRTPPMRDGRPASSGERGTYYVCAVSGTKFYPQDPRDYAAAAHTDLRTDQVIDIDAQSQTLRYRAFDEAGEVVDELTIAR